VRALAQAWERSLDKKTYRFTIRDTARWSDGTPITAQDFVDSWMRILDLNAEYATFFDIMLAQKNIEPGYQNKEQVGIKALSTHELEVNLTRPAAYFTRLLCHQSFHYTSFIDA